MPGSRSVYRTPNTMEAQSSADPQLTLEWNDHMAASNHGMDMTFDAQSEVGLISPKNRSIFDSCCNTFRGSSNWRVFALITVILLLFLSGFAAGFMTRRYVQKSTVSSLSSDTTDVEQIDVNMTHFYHYNYSDFVRTEFFKAIDVEKMGEDVKTLTSFKEHRAGLNEEVKNYIFSELSKVSPVIVKKHSSKVLLSSDCGSDTYNTLSQGSKSIWNSKDNDNAFLAYAPNRTVEGKIVFANFGRPQDFAALEKAGVNLRDTIALVRYGRVSRGIKVQMAQRYHCAGLILYTESPKDSNLPWVGGNVRDKAAFGSIMNLDALPYVTPSILPLNVEEYTSRLRKMEILPNIAAITISESAAAELISALNAETSPPFNAIGEGLADPAAGKVLRVGPTSAVYTLQSCSKVKVGEITNIVGILPGYVEKDRFAIIASHHDAWGPGAVNSYSGVALMLGLARAVAKNPELRPRRSLMFVSFDAEELGLLGSVEFVKRLETQFGAGSAVGAICLDGVLRGQYIPYIRADPIMRNLFYDAASNIQTVDEAAKPMKLFDLWKKRSSFKPSTDKPFIAELDTSSDHAMLSFFAGIPTAAVQYWYDYSTRFNMTWYPTYHTSLDTYDYLSKTVDPEWKGLTVASQLVGDVMLRLADLVLVPLDCSPVGDYMMRANDDFKLKLTGITSSALELTDLNKIDSVIDNFKVVCSKVMNLSQALISTTNEKTHAQSWHYADVRVRNDALVLALQAFVQQPLTVGSLSYIGSQTNDSAKLDFAYEKLPPAHSSLHMRHVLFPPSVRMNPDRNPAFFALSAAVQVLNATLDSSDANAISLVKLEYERLIDGIEHAIAIMERVLDLRLSKK